jgi:hypothetical protein
MPARSAQITVFNATSFTLDKFKGELCHGSFTDPFSFPQTIEPGQSVMWEAESSGSIPIIGSIGTGTEGWVKYQVREVGDIILFYWDVPFEGNVFFGYNASAADNQDPGTLFGTASCVDNSKISFGSNFPTPSRFDFFPLHFVVSGDPRNFPPRTYTPGAIGVFGVDEGNVGDEGIFTNFADPNGFDHAWFAMGICDTQSTSMLQVCSATGLDASKGLLAAFPGATSIDVRRDLFTVHG